jgi:PAS domain S-box-containing protein
LLEAATLHEAAPRILEAIGDDLEWELGAIWMHDEATDRLRAVHPWRSERLPPSAGDAFAAAWQETRFERGAGLPGRVWESGEPAWVADLAHDDNFPRLQTVVEHGIRSAFAFPIRGLRGVIGVVEFFSQSAREPDELLVQATAVLGNQIGQFVEHRRVEVALRASEARTRAIVESALDCIITIDTEGRLLEFNPAAERTFGYRREDVIGRSMAELIIPPPLRGAHYHGVARYLATGEGPILGKRVEIAALRADGSEFPVELAITSIEGQGAPLFTAYIRDITERKNAERDFDQLLLDTEAARADAEAASARLRATQLVTDTALLHLNRSDLLVELCERIRAVLGVDNVAVLLLDPTESYLTIHTARGPEEEVAELVHVPLGRGFAGRIAATRMPLVVDDVHELEVANLFLRERIYSLLGVPLMVDDRLLGVIHIGTVRPHHFTEDDVRLLQLVADRVALAIDHARLYDAEALARSEAAARAGELEATFQAMAEGVFVCNAAGQLTHVNATGAALFGLTPEQALISLSPLARATMLRAADGSPLAPEEYPLTMALAGQTHTGLQYTIRADLDERGLDDRGNPLGRHVRMSCAPIRNAAGEIVGGLAVASDITELYRLERQKDEFLSIASHELKTPLTSLKILAQLIRRRLARAGSTIEAGQFERMDRAIERMERLINDLLDVTRIEAGKLALNRAHVDLAQLARQVAEEHAAASEREVRLEAPSDAVVVHADADRVAQVLANLISNALKYSPSDQPVNVRVSVTATEALVAVHDRGPGIPPEALEHIFERFYRAPGVEVQSGSGVGLGLGLYITHELVERHGGRIWAASVVGQGSTFSFALPLAAD